MVKILTLRENHVITYTCTCRNCGSELRFEQSEGTFVPDSRDGSFYKFNCPVCNRGIDVSAAKGIVKTDVKT